MNKVNIVLRNDTFHGTKSHASPSKFLASPTSRIKLSTSIDKSLMTFGIEPTTTLNLQNRFIEELDQLPLKYKRVHTLVLNNNHLKNLRGVEQFPKLKKLYVIDNNLDDILNVYYLAAVQNLEEVDFRGNPIVNMPNYHDTVLLFAPSLKTLDGKVVKPHEKDRIRPEVRRQYVLLEKLLANYVDLIKLQSVVKKLDVHKELFNKDRRFIMNFVPFSVSKFRKMYDYFEDIDEKVRNDYRTDLLRDVHTIEVNFLQKNDIEIAVEELASRQTAKVAELVKQVEKKASVFQLVYKANIDKFKRFKINEDSVVLASDILQDSRSPRTSTVSRLKSPGGPRSKRSVIFNDQTMRSARSTKDLGPRKSNISYRGNDRSVSKERSSPNRSIQGKSSKAGNPQTERGRIEGTVNVVPKHRKFLSVHKMPSPPRPDGSEEVFNTDEDMPRQLSISQTQLINAQNMGYDNGQKEEQNLADSLEAENVITEEIVPTEIVVEKDKEITFLAKQLQEKIEYAIKIEDVNKKIKDKLRDFEVQNEKNSKMSKEEIDKTLQKAQTIKNTHDMMEKELKQLRQTLKEITNKNDGLEKDKDKLERENSYLAVFKDEVQVRQTYETKEHSSSEYYERRLSQKTFFLLRKAVQRSKIVDEMNFNSKTMRNYTLLEACFGTLKRAMIIRRIGQFRQRERNAFLLENIMNAWRNIVRKERVVVFLGEKRKTDLLYAALVCWSHYRDIRINRKAIKAKVRSYANDKRLRNGLDGFKANFSTFRHDEDVEEELDECAVTHKEARVLKNCFARWREYIKEEAIPKRLKNRMALILSNRNLQTFALNLIKQNYMISSKAYDRADNLTYRRQQKVLRLVFGRWANDFRVICKIKHEEREVERLFLLRQRFSTWRNAFARSQRLNILTRNADSYYVDRLQVKGLSSLSMYCATTKHSKNVHKHLKAKTAQNLVANAYKIWSTSFKRNQGAQRRAELRNLEAQREYFDRWQEFFRNQKDEKYVNGMASRLYQKAAGRQMVLIFNTWHAFGRWSKRCKKLVKEIRRKHLKKLCKKAFEELRIQRLRNYRGKYNKTCQEYKAGKELAEKREEELNISDAERVESVRRYDDLCRDMEDFRNDIMKKEKHTERCREYVRNRDEAIDKLDVEAIEKGRDIENLERENKKITENIQRRMRESEGITKEFLAEKSRLNEELLQLERELDRKTKDVDASARENLQYSEEVEECVRNNEGIIDSFCRELKELKTSLTLKEQEVKEATELIGEFEVRNKALKDQVEDTLNDIEKSSVHYSERIKELEAQNVLLMEEMRFLDRQNEKQVEEIRELKSLIRRIEQEVGLIAEQQHKDTEEFIKNLHKRRTTNEQISVRLSNRPSSPAGQKNGNPRVERDVNFRTISSVGFRDSVGSTITEQIREVRQITGAIWNGGIADFDGATHLTTPKFYGAASLNQPAKRSLEESRIEELSNSALQKSVIEDIQSSVEAIKESQGILHESFAIKKSGNSPIKE